MRHEDLTGKRFGKLTVLYRVEDYVYEKNGKRKSKWHCRCDCGNEVDILAPNLKRNHTTSCGCARTAAGERRRRDLTGERFGRLICIRREEGRNWLFQCDCGNKIVAFASNVTTGKTRSCGKDCGLKDHPMKEKESRKATSA